MNNANHVSQNLFKEFQPPELQKIMKISQPQDDISLQFWDHLLCAFEIRSSDQKIHQKQKSNTMSYIFYKGTMGNVILLHFEQQCLVLQKSFKLLYAIQKQITCLKCFDFGQNYNLIIKQNQKNNKKPTSPINGIFCVGYQDATLQIYYFSHSPNDLSLKKIILIKSLNNVSQPISNIIMHNKDLYVVKLHFISLYKEIMKQIIKKVCGSDKLQLTCTQTNIKFKEILESTKVSLQVNVNMHVYTETVGLFSFSLPNLIKIGSLVDQIKVFRETQQQDWILGSSQDNLKIIYRDSNQIQRFIGLKNFPSCIQVVKNNDLLEIFVCDMNGQLHYFRKAVKKENSSSKEQSVQKQLIIFDEKLKKGKKISQFGIKKTIILENMLIIQDNQQNITIFDIINQEAISTNRTKTVSED